MQMSILYLDAVAMPTSAEVNVADTRDKHGPKDRGVDVAPPRTEGETVPPYQPVRLGSTSAYQLAAQVIALGVNFIVSVLIARTLGPAGKGQLSVLQQVPGVLMVVLSFGLAYSNFYFVGRRKQPAGEALGNSILAALAGGAIGAPIVWLFTIGPLAVVPDLPVSGAIVAAALLPVALVASFATSVGNGLGLLKKASLANMIATGLTLLLVLAAYALGQLNVTAVLAISVTTGLVSLAFVVSAMRSRLGHLAVRIAAFRESAKYSLKSYLGNLAGYLNYRFDIILVGYLAGAASVGIYSIAVTFAELMWYVPNALATSILSKSMGLDASEGPRLTSRTSRVTSLLMTLVCLVAAALISPVVRVFYGPEFASAVPPFLILLPGVWLVGVGKVASGHLAAQGHLFPGISMISTALNLAANLLLIPWMGVTGAALASTLSYVLVGGWILIIFRRLTSIDIRRMIIPDREDLRAVTQSVRSYLKAIIERR